MGNSCNVSTEVTINNWVLLDKSNDFNIYYNSKSLQEAVEHFQFFDDQKGGKDSHIFFLRQNCSSLVNAYLVDSNDCYLNSKTYKKRRILVENIKFKLDCLSLEQDQMYYCFLEALKGYNQIYNSMGYIDITSEMIGINKDGKIKVWIDQDFTKNLKDSQNYSKQIILLNEGQGFQYSMMHKLCRLINKVCVHNKIPQILIQQSFQKTIDNLYYLIKTKQVMCSKRIRLHNLSLNTSYLSSSGLNFKNSVASTRIPQL